MNNFNIAIHNRAGKNIYQCSSISNNVGFKSTTTNTLERTPESDTLEKKTPEKMSNVKKVGLGIGLGLTTVLATGLCLMKRDANKIAKLYKDKLVLSNLPEKINFKEATSVEEGIKFAKEVLGIKHVDEGFTLEAINFANKGLVDVSNAHKGKCFIPHSLLFKFEDSSVLAAVYRNVRSKEFGNMFINKKYYQEDILNKELEKICKEIGFTAKESSKSLKKEQNNVRSPLIQISFSDEIKELANKFLSNNKSMSITEKGTLLCSIKQGLDDGYGLIERSPYYTLERFKEVFSRAGINYNLEEFVKLSTKDQTTKLTELINSLIDKTGNGLIIKAHTHTPARTIHHEAGHLQDYAKNLKELDMKSYEIFTKDFWKNLFKRSKDGNYDSSRKIDELGNRWGSIWDKETKKLLEENPEKFKKLHPDLYEFATSKKIQQTAGKVSAYAQAGIGEFIAETYAKMIHGAKIPEDVMALYKRYGGPLLS